MTPEQRYEFDLQGWVHLPSALTPTELEQGRAAAYEATGASSLPDAPGSSNDARRPPWRDPRLGQLYFNQTAWPVIMELTRGQPMVRLGLGRIIHDSPGGSSGGGMLHSNREGQRSSTVGSPSMARYIAGRDGTIYCQDFVMFVYLDDVEPGDGGVCLVAGSHKARFERPTSLFGTYGTGNHANDPPGSGLTPVGYQSAPIGSDDLIGANRGPPHTVNPTLRAGDILIMSECTTHGVVPWRGAGHRHVLKCNFKAGACYPEDAMAPEEILLLPPELRELRSYCPDGQAKQRALAGPITLSAPTGAPVTPAELTPLPYHRATPEDLEVLDQLQTGPPPSLPPVQNGFTDEQRYLFDTHGFLQIPDVLGAEELAACRAAANDYMSTDPQDMPKGFGQTPGKKWLHAFAWSPVLERLCMHPRLWPIILELFDGKPKLGAASGTMWWEDADTAAAGVSDPAAAPSGAHGVRLHCSRESAGWDSHTAIFDVHHGRIHVGHALVFIYLEDIDPGEGGLLVVPGSHKSNFDRVDSLAVHGPYGGRQEDRGSVVLRDAPGATECPDGCVNVAPIKAGSAVIITEATTHGVLPYMGKPGRKRNMIVFGYEPQYVGLVPPDESDEPWMARLSEETKELMQYAHITHTKKIAMDWRSGFLPPAMGTAVGTSKL